MSENERNPSPPAEPAELARTVHELMVHQVELEMQNEELIEARAEIEANAELLADLYDFAPVGYFSLTARGLIRQLNFMGAKLLGRERGVLMEKSFTDFVAPASRPAFSAFLSKVFSGDATGFCELDLTPSGRPGVTVSLTANLSRNGLVCRLAAMDVTAQRQVEAEVREKNEDLDRIFNLSHDLLGIATKDGRFQRVNPAFERVLGHPSEVLTGLEFVNFVHRDDREATWRTLARIRAGEDVLDFVNRYRCADGTYRWLEWRATPYGNGLIYASARDITERKHVEAALRRSEERFRSIVDSSPTAMYLYQLDADDRLVLRVANPAADKELGIVHGELIGKTLEEAFPNLQGTEIPDIYRAVAKGEIGIQRFETSYEGHGISGYFEVHVFQTSPGTIVVSFSDIGERRKAREALRRSHEELEFRVQRRTAQLQQRTRQLRALADELTHAEERERRRIAGLIHEDLQQMLVAALLNLGMLRSRMGDTTAATDCEHIERILRDSVKTARSLTAELSPPVLQQCGLAASLNWLRTWFAEKYGTEVAVEAADGVDLCPELSVALFRCVRELLFNIVKHAGVTKAVLRLLRRDDEALVIEVRDEGCGFDPEEVRSREGSVGGFGLFSIRERMESLGGGFEIESAPGAGSRFTLWIPLDIAAPEKSGPKAVVSVPMLPGK